MSNRRQRARLFPGSSPFAPGSAGGWRSWFDAERGIVQHAVIASVTASSELVVLALQLPLGEVDEPVEFEVDLWGCYLLVRGSVILANEFAKISSFY